MTFTVKQPRGQPFARLRSIFILMLFSGAVVLFLRLGGNSGLIQGAILPTPPICIPSVISCPADYECGTVDNGCGLPLTCGICLEPTSECHTDEHRCYCPTPDPVTTPLTVTVNTCALPDQKTPVTLGWGASPNANNYLVEVDDDKNFASIDYATKTTATQTTFNLPAGDWYWRVTAINNCGAVEERWGTSTAVVCDTDNPAQCQTDLWSIDHL